MVVGRREGRQGRKARWARMVGEEAMKGGYWIEQAGVGGVRAPGRTRTCRPCLLVLLQGQSVSNRAGARGRRTGRRKVRYQVQTSASAHPSPSSVAGR